MNEADFKTAVAIIKTGTEPPRVAREVMDRLQSAGIDVVSR